MGNVIDEFAMVLRHWFFVKRLLCIYALTVRIEFFTQRWIEWRTVDISEVSKIIGKWTCKVWTYIELSSMDLYSNQIFIPRKPLKVLSH